MDVYGRLCLLGILLDNFSGAKGQCVRSGLDILVPNYDIRVLSYPDDSSPNYGQRLNCKWLFRSADTTLRFIFRVALLVACGDVLKAFDGTTEGYPPIADPFCTSQTTPYATPYYVTSSYQMFLSFITDTSTDAQRDKGFKVEILSARPVAYEAEACNSNIKTLIATTDEEVLTSPSFPDKYNSSTKCSWNITSPTEPGTIRIIVRFLDTDVYKGACYDNITTYDGQERKTLCDTSSFKLITLLFNSSFVAIGFDSGPTHEGKGFLLRYSFLGEAATTESSTTSTTKTTEISTTEATTTTSIAETTTMSTAETTTSSSETTSMSTAEYTIKSTSETTAMSTTEITAMSTAEITMSTSKTTTMSTSETTAMSTAETTSTSETTTMSSSETTTMSTAESTTKSTSETTTGTITTETTISETTHSISISSSSPTAEATQNQILSLTSKAGIFLVVLLIVILVFGMTVCILFCFARNKKRKRSTVSSCSSAPLHWRRHFIGVDYLRNKSDRNKPKITHDSCTKCWQTDHFARSCPNERKCAACKEPGHKPGSSMCSKYIAAQKNVITIRGSGNVLSNFYPCDIKVFGENFNSAEQAYQFTKAIRTGNIVAADKIRDAKTALECKQIGKTITNTPQWRDEADKVMDEILCAKIYQLKEMKDLLSSSKPNTLFAHSVYDLYWGTGLDTEQTKHTDPVSWPGQNMFGKLIQRPADKHRGNRSTNKPRCFSAYSGKNQTARY